MSNLLWTMTKTHYLYFVKSDQKKKIFFSLLTSLWLLHSRWLTEFLISTQTHSYLCDLQTGSSTEPCLWHQCCKSNLTDTSRWPPVRRVIGRPCLSTPLKKETVNQRPLQMSVRPFQLVCFLLIPTGFHGLEWIALGYVFTRSWKLNEASIM